ncbi:MAG: hemagglutinin repeat-containing protein [Alcanivorax sp.]|nr:hemagglutinin repeat-containing protein [Alcanivorax sp.]
MIMPCAQAFPFRTDRVGFRVLVARLLIPVMMLQPIVASANAVTVAHGQTAMDQAANGIDVINIARPDGSGLSHNFYHQFNVGPDGLILNNATAISHTDLAGFIDLNPHLQGQAAGIILNEVISANPSQLHGYIEVGGQKADVVVANPYGIQCNGCGFINTSRATLTTGRPRLGDNGGLQGFDIDGGAIDFEGAGINAANIDRFDVLAQSVRINAELHANALNIVAGAHYSDYSDLSVSGAGDGSGAPAFAIDSSALGGIYANRIRLIGTEAGVGINLDAPVAAQQGNLHMSAEGQITYQRLSAAEDMHISAASIQAQGDATAGGRAVLSAPEIAMQSGALEARHVEMRGDRLTVAEDASVTAIDGAAAKPVRLDIQVAQLDNEGALLSEGDARVVVSGRLDNAGSIRAAGTATVSAGRLHNEGDMESEQALRIDAREYRHAGGNIDSAQHVTLNANRVTIDAGAAMRLHSDAEINAYLLENNGILTSAAGLDIHAEILQNQGDIAGMQGLRYQGDTLINSRGALFFSAAPMQLSLRILENLGDIYALGHLTVDGRAMPGMAGGAVPWAQQVRNVSGLLASEGDIRIAAHRIENVRSEAPEFVIVWDDAYVMWGEDPEEAERNELCFNRNKSSGCSGTTRRITYQKQKVDDLQLNAEAGRIMAGGDIHMVADIVLNSISRIVATGDVALSATQVRNETHDVQLAEHIRTDYSERKKRKNSAMRTKNRKYTYTTMDYDEDPEFCRNSTNRCGRGDPSFAGETSVTETIVGSQIEAGGSINIHASEQFGNGTVQGDQDISFGNTLAAIYGDDGEYSQETLFRLAPLDPNVFRLPGHTGLFVLNSNPDHPYLIETNALLADYMKFLGTPYMLQRLGWDPDGGLRLLGDGFYELTLIIQALADAGADTADLDREAQQALFVELMDNALYSSEALELVPGVALSAEQVGLLQQDIVWLESQNIGGHEVLVPVVYLAGGAQPGRAAEALLSGADVAISAGVINNRGHIHASGSAQLDATAGNLTNTGHINAGDTLTLAAAEDVNNLGGLLQAAEMTLRAVGNINVSTRQFTFGDENAWISAVGEQARIQAGTLNAQSGGDIVLDGASVEGDDITLAAEGSILMGTVEASHGAGLHRRNTQRRDEHVRVMTTDVLGNANVLLQAGEHILASASQLASGGDLSLVAGGDIDFGVAYERDYLFDYSRRTQSFGRSRESMRESDSQNVVGGTLSAAGDLTVRSGGDMHLTSVDMNAGDDIALMSGGSLLIDSAANIHSTRETRSRTGYTTASASGSSEYSLTHQASQLDAGGNLLIMSKDDAALVGADLSAGADVLLSAGLYIDEDGVRHTNADASLALLDTHDEWYYDSYSERSRRDLAGIATSVVAAGMGMVAMPFNPEAGARQLRDNLDAGMSARSGRTETSGESTETSRGTTVAAGGNLLLQSAADMLIVGSEVQGLREQEDGHYAIDASTTLIAGSLIDPLTGRLMAMNDDADVLIAAGVNHHDEYRDVERYRTDYLGVFGANLAQGFATASSAISGDYSRPASMPTDMGTRRQGSEYRLETVTLTESLIHDSQHLSILASGDITTVASQLISGGNMALSAGGDLNLNAGLETLSEFHAQYHSQFDSFTGGYDRGRLYAGIEGQNYREETLYEQGTAVGSNVSVAGTLTLDVGGDVNVIGSDVTAERLEGRVGGTMNIAAAEEYERTTHKVTDETVSLTAGVGNSYLDAYYAADDLVKASEDVKKAYDALKAARDDPRVSASDLSDYEANLALAILQQQAVGIQAATSLAGAIENAPVAGFHGNVQLATETTRTTDVREATTHHGSSVLIGEGGMALQGEALRVAGSELSVAGDMDLAVDRFTVEAVEDRFTHNTSTESYSGTVTLASSSRSNLSGMLAVESLSASGGLGHSSSTSSSEGGQWQHGEVNVGGVLYLDVSGDTTLHGGTVQAGAIVGQTGNLTVTSVQDTMSSRHSSRGVNLGGGQGFNVNGGYNTASGSADRAWVEQVSGLYGAGYMDLTVEGHTQLDGGYIASGNEEHSRFETGTFAYTDIEDHDYGHSSGWGLNTSLNPLDLAERQRAPQGSTTVNVHREGHDMAGVTRATVGVGTLVVRDEDSENNSDLAGLNRDMDAVQEVTRDRLTGGLNVTLTLDHRLLDKQNGWPEIARDVATAVGLPVDVARSVMDVLGERGVLELGTLVHQYGLTRKLTQEIQRFEHYSELRATLAERLGVAEEDVGPALRAMLREIGSVAAQDPEQLARAQALFGEAGEKGLEGGVKDGDLLKVRLHQAVGDALAGADGASAAGTTELLMPLLVELSGGSPERLLALSRIVGGASSEDAATGALIAQQGTQYNRQLHQGELVAIRENAREYAREHEGMSESEALTVLLLEGMRQVDAGYAEHISSDPQAAAFLNQLAADNPHMQIVSDSGHQGSLFETSHDDYWDSSVNAFHLWDMENTAGHPVRNALLDGMGQWMAGSEALSDIYFPVFDAAGDYAASQQLNQLWIPVMGLAVPGVMSGGAATYGYATTQGQFWGGVASQAGTRWMQSTGAAGQTNIWAVGNVGSYGAAKVNMLGMEMIYGVGRTAQNFTAITGAAGFVSEVVGGVPGFPDTPPAYIPDGLPMFQAAAPWQTGAAIGAGVRDGYFLFEQLVSGENNVRSD